LARKDYTAAIRHAERMLAIDPDGAEANRLFNAAIDAAYGTVDAHFAVELPGFVDGSYPGLKEAIQRRIAATIRRIAPGPIEAAAIGNRYTLIEHRLTRERITAQLSEELQADPDDATGRLVRAMVYVAMKRTAEALPDCQMLVEAHPEQEEYQLLYGLYLLNNGQVEGIAQLDRVLESAPDNVAAAFYRAVCHEAA
jgi:tetratricopeptide (TPR) repeat protein